MQPPSVASLYQRALFTAGRPVAYRGAGHVTARSMAAAGHMTRAGGGGCSDQLARTAGGGDGALTQDCSVLRGGGISLSVILPLAAGYCHGTEQQLTIAKDRRESRNVHSLSFSRELRNAVFC